MTKRKKFILLFIGIFIMLCGVLFWAINSPTVDDYYFLYNRDKEADLAVAFTVALRINHPLAYDMIDEDSTPRLEEWMRIHQAQKCTKRVDDILIFGSGDGLVVYYVCQTENNKLYKLSVDEIIIEDMKIVDWGEILEE